MTLYVQKNDITFKKDARKYHAWFVSALKLSIIKLTKVGPAINVGDSWSDVNYNIKRTVHGVQGRECAIRKKNTLILE